MSREVLFCGRQRQWLAEPVIYGLVDPRDLERIRYVGATIDPASRYASHLWAPRARVTPREVWVGSLAKDDLRPTMVVLERTVREKMIQRENYWIATLRALGQADLNSHNAQKRIPVLENYSPEPQP